LGVFTEAGERIESVLRRNRGGILDVRVKAGAEGKAYRLVAVRATGKVARQRRQMRREEAAAKGVEPDPVGLLRDGWHLMLTNLPTEDFPPTLLRAVYRARWGGGTERSEIASQEEIRFTAGKSSSAHGSRRRISIKPSTAKAARPISWPSSSWR